MKVRVDIDESYQGEIIIKAPKLNETVSKIQTAIMDVISESRRLEFYKDETDYYISLEKIIFFETSEGSISAHTINDVYQTRYRLYELEEMLPGYFMRVSKSTILNTNHIYSITRNLTASSLVDFDNTHKKVYVSRSYYKALKCRLEEKRLNK